MLLWIESQMTSIITLIMFGAAYLSAALISCVAALLSRRPIPKGLQAVTPGVLSPLGAILGILIAFLAVRVWTNLDHAQEQIGHEVTALREVVMLANSLPADVRARVREAVGKHLKSVVSDDWPAMAEARISLHSFPPHLEEAMGAILSFAPVGASQQLVQNRALFSVEDAVEFRRNRVIVSRAEIAPVQWAVIIVLSGMFSPPSQQSTSMRDGRWRSRCSSFQPQSRCVLFS
jgi:Protein of unknown function (DUF4239)